MREINRDGLSMRWKRGASPVGTPTYLGVVLVYVFIVGHFHQTMSQVVVGEDEETGLEIAVHKFQVLRDRK